MGLVQSGFLAALSALTIPILIHLALGRRARRVELGTLRFLRMVLNENARRKRLKRWLLLALRMACVALLVLLFARPYLIAHEAADSRDRITAILIDRSASMMLDGEDGRLVDRAVSEAHRLVEQVGEGADVEVAFFDHAVHPVKEPFDLQAPETSYSATDYGRALSWARDVCLKSEKSQKEIHLFTDLQRSGLDWTADEQLPAEIRGHVHDLGRAAVNNVAVTALRHRALVRPGETVSITAAIRNAGPFPIEEARATLSLGKDGRTRQWRERISVEPGITETVRFEVPDLEEGLWKGTVGIEAEDELNFDNRRHLAVMAAPPMPVLLLDGDPDRRPLFSETYFLETALQLAPPGETYAGSDYRPKTVAFSETGPLPNLQPFRVIVLANVPRIEQPAAERLARFVAGGGNLLVFTGDNVQAEGYEALQSAGLEIGTIRGPARARGLPERLEKWDTEHSIFEPFNDPQHGDLRRLAFQTYTRIEPAEGVRVPARFRNGDPALLERRHGRGRILWFATACDRDWSNWPGSPLFVPMVHQMLGSLTGLIEGGPVRERRIESSHAADAESVPGLYERNGYWEVINSSPRESDPERCTLEEFAGRLGIRQSLASGGRQPADAQPAPVEQDSLERPSYVADLREDEIWHWIAFAVLGILFAEGFLANRTTS